MHDNNEPHTMTVGSNVAGQNICNMIVIVSI